MTRTRIILVVAAAVLFCRAGANTHTDEAAQTDTSRGLGVYGPVSEKGDTFDTKTDVDLFTYAGDALLVLTPKTPVKHVVDDNFKSTYSVQAVDVDPRALARRHLRVGQVVVCRITAGLRVDLVVPDAALALLAGDEVEVEHVVVVEVARGQEDGAERGDVVGIVAADLTGCRFLGQ